MTSKVRKFVTAINDAFARTDAEFIAARVADDVRSTMAGGETVEGKGAFVEGLKMMEGTETTYMNVHDILVDGNRAAVIGEMGMVDKEGDSYEFDFCDTYLVSDEPEPKIKELKAFVVEKS